MWVMTISSLVCFAISTVLFTPKFRGLAIYQSLAFYFIFKGFWYVFSLVASLIWPGNSFMPMVGCIGTIVFGIYILACCYKYSKKS